MKKIVAIYARLSREDEDKIDGNTESRSIENQIKVLSDYATSNDFQIYDVYYDDGFTGANLDRPDFQRMLKDMKGHRFNTLLVKDFSRIGRTLHHVGNLIEQVFPENNIRVISLNDNYDSETYSDDESVVLRAFLNAYYLKDFRRKCQKARMHVANTKHMNYYPKYGYRFDENRKEQIDPYSAGVVKKIFEHAASGEPSPKIADMLNEAEILTRSSYMVKVLGEKPMHKVVNDVWTGAKVLEIIRDYEYCGHSLNLTKKRQNTILLKNTHFAIIDEDLFKRANDMINSRTTKQGKYNHLGGIMFDMDSGYHIAYCGQNSGHKNFKPYYYSKQNHFRIYENILHSLIYNEVINLIQDCLTNTDAVKDLYRKRIFNNSNYSKEDLEFKLKSFNDEFARLFSSYINKEITELQFNSKATNLKNKIEDIENKINKFNSSVADMALYERKFSQFLLRLKSIPTDKVDLIKSLVSRIEIKRNKDQTFEIKLQYKFEQ